MSLIQEKKFTQVNKLYWDKGKTQKEIAALIGRDQATVCRMLSGKYISIESVRKNKKRIYSANFRATGESIQRIKNRRRYETKLTPAKAQKIKNLYFSAKKNQAQLARMFRINQCTVHRVIAGGYWKVIR